MDSQGYIPAIPERSHIHVDRPARRRAEGGAPSIDAVYERSRHGVPEDHSRRSSRQMQNGGVSWRAPGSHEGRRQSGAHLNQVHPAGGEGYRGGGHESRRHYERDRDYYYDSRHVRGGGATHVVYEDDYDDDGDDRYVVPALPMPLAIICCVLNFIAPGFGTMIAGFCVLCCGRTEGMSCGDKCSSCCFVFGIGVVQLLLVACFLIGWIWSCIWGVTFIGMAVTRYDDEYDEYEYYTEAEARRRHVPTGNTPLPTPEVVVDQPYPGVRYEDLEPRPRDRRQRTRGRRTISRIALTPSNFIYPMRAPSSIHYSSPPPPYKETATPPPSYWRNTPRNAGTGEGRGRDAGAASNSRPNERQQQQPQAASNEDRGRR